MGALDAAQHERRPSGWPACSTGHTSPTPQQPRRQRRPTQVVTDAMHDIVTAAAKTVSNHTNEESEKMKSSRQVTRFGSSPPASSHSRKGLAVLTVGLLVIAASAVALSSGRAQTATAV